MNLYDNFLKENGLTKKLVESTSKVGINNRTNDINYTINSISKLNSYLQNGFLNTKLYHLNIYEFPLVEDDIENELSLLFSFKEIYVIDLMKLLYNKKVFLNKDQMLVGGQDKILYRIIDIIENQSQNIKLITFFKCDKNIEDFLTNIFITFSITGVNHDS